MKNKRHIWELGVEHDKCKVCGILKREVLTEDGFKMLRFAKTEYFADGKWDGTHNSVHRWCVKTTNDEKILC